MSKNKSLGSSPVGLGSGNSSKMGFIPDLGVSKIPKQKKSRSSKKERTSLKSEHKEEQQKEDKKKVVSYSLEASLVAKVKSVADKKDMYYSGIVSKALKQWLRRNTN